MLPGVGEVAVHVLADDGLLVCAGHVVPLDACNRGVRGGRRRGRGRLLASPHTLMSESFIENQTPEYVGVICHHDTRTSHRLRSSCWGRPCRTPCLRGAESPPCCLAEAPPGRPCVTSRGRSGWSWWAAWRTGWRTRTSRWCSWGRDRVGHSRLRKHSFFLKIILFKVYRNRTVFRMSRSRGHCRPWIPWSSHILAECLSTPGPYIFFCSNFLRWTNSSGLSGAGSQNQASWSSNSGS